MFSTEGDDDIDDALEGNLVWNGIRSRSMSIFTSMSIGEGVLDISESTSMEGNGTYLRCFTLTDCKGVSAIR